MKFRYVRGRERRHTMQVTKEKAMRQTKRRMPAITLPKVKALNYALVFAGHPHGEHLTAILRTMDFTILSQEIGTKDKPHASSFFARIMSIHDETGLSSWQAASEPVAELQQKNPKCRTSG